LTIVLADVTVPLDAENALDAKDAQTGAAAQKKLKLAAARKPYISHQS